MVDLMFRDESNHVIKRATTARTRNSRQRHGPTAPPPPPSPRPARTRPSRPFRTICGPSISSSSSLSSPSPTLLAVINSRCVAASTSSDDSQLDDLDFNDDQLERLDSLSPTLLFRYGPTVSLQERGTAFFFSRYVAADHGCYQNYNFIYDVWKPPPSGDMQTDCITASMTAVGLTGLSKLTRCPETMTRARQSYGIALQLTNLALKNPDEAIKDSTMLAVLILGTYEFISGRTPQTVRAWQEHVNGAAALASMRGAAQFRTRTGSKMFLMLCHTVLISCIQSGLPMPRVMLDLRDELWLLTNGGSPTWRVVDALQSALRVRHDIRTRKLTGLNEVLETLSACEQKFAEIIADLPPSWCYRRVRLTRDNPAVMGQWCHIYAGLTQATTWNGVRTMRMLVQETILEQICNSVDDPTTLPMHRQLQLVKAMRLLQMLGEAVIGSVPQHFGIVSSRDIKRAAQNDAVPLVTPSRSPQYILSSASQQVGGQVAEACTTRLKGTAHRPTLLDPTQSINSQECDTERFMTLATSSNTIIWPLYTLGMSSSCTHEIRDYIVDRLDSIHRDTGLEQARVVAGMVKEKSESLTWDNIPVARLPVLPDDALPEMV